MKLEEKNRLLYPEGCECVQTYNGGKILVHTKTMLVLNCVFDAAEC